MSKPIDFDYIEKFMAAKAAKGELYSPEEAEVRFNRILRRMLIARPLVDQLDRLQGSEP